MACQPLHVYYQWLINSFETQLVPLNDLLTVAYVFFHFAQHGTHCHQVDHDFVEQ